VAELDPHPDVTASVRKVPVRTPAASLSERPAQSLLPASTTPAGPAPAGAPAIATPTTAPPTTAPPSQRRPIVLPSAPERYRVQFTIGPQAHEKLRRLQTLLRREIPSGDPGLIFERAVEMLLDKVERSKLGKVARPRKRAAIRSGTDTASAAPSDRHVPNEIKRAVGQRDGGRCAFVSAGGNRCNERSYLEFHHLQPFALGGPATVENISLRCRAHNQYEARLIFGPHGVSRTGEAETPYAAGPRRLDRTTTPARGSAPAGSRG
jgi:hypothetical protein